MERNIQLIKEIQDPLKANDIEIIFNGYSQIQNEYQSHPVSSLKFCLKFFNYPIYVTERIPLLVEVEKHKHETGKLIYMYRIDQIYIVLNNFLFFLF
jgi:hypothetical protein